MKLLAFIPIKLTLLLILGIIIVHLFPIAPIYLGYATILFFILLSVIFSLEKNRNSILFGCMAALTFISLGGYCYAAAQPINHPKHYSKSGIEKPTLWTLKIKEVLKPNSYTTRYFAAVQCAEVTQTTGSVLISIPIDSSSKILHVDDELIAYGKFQPIKGPLNPHQFNYKEYLENLGIYHQLQIAPNQFVTIEHPKVTFIGIASKARNHIIRKLKTANFGADELGVMQALLLGQRSDISEETYSNYQKAGAVHILAVSGLHIGVLLLLLQFLLQSLKYLPNGRTIILLISVILLWGFAFLAGLSASIIRATTMFTFVAYALYLNRPSNSFNILALSVLFILLFINPNLLFQVGFQMSYAAVFAILWIFPLLQKLWCPKTKVARYFWQLLSVSIAAQVGVLPISLFYFHQFPGLFFVSNIVIIPALGVVLGVGILIILLSLLNALPTQLVWFYNEIIHLMNSIVGWVARQESFIFSSLSFDFGQLLLSFLVLIVCINLCTRFTYNRIAIFLFGLLCFQGWTLFQTYKATEKNEVVILHQIRNSVLLNRTGRKLAVLTNHHAKADHLISDYKTGERIRTSSHDSLKNSYALLNSQVLIIDSTGIYTMNPSTRTVLLTQSPKINLDRLLETNRTIKIIADGSNYRSYIERWKKTCIKNKTPFHYTGEEGAYYIDKPF